MANKSYIKSADTIIDIFSDMRLTDEEIPYIAQYVVLRSYPKEVLARIILFGDQVKEQLEHYANSHSDNFVEEEDY